MLFMCNEKKLQFESVVVVDPRYEVRILRSGVSSNKNYGPFDICNT